MGTCWAHMRCVVFSGFVAFMVLCVASSQVIGCGLYRGAALQEQPAQDECAPAVEANVFAFACSAAVCRPAQLSGPQPHLCADFPQGRTDIVLAQAQEVRPQLQAAHAWITAGVTDRMQGLLPAHAATKR